MTSAKAPGGNSGHRKAAGNGLSLTLDEILALASSFRTAGFVPSAIAALRRALQAKPGHAVAAKQLAEAERMLKARPELNHESSPIDKTFVLAQFIHRLGRLEEAERIYRSILEDEPAHADTLHFLGLLMHNRGADSEAIALIERSRALVPDQPDWMNNHALVLASAGRLADAIALYRRAVAVSRDDPNTFSNLGIALRAIGDTKGAEEAYRHALAINPDHGAAHNNLANLLVSSKRIKEGIEHAYRAVKLTQRDGAPLALIADAFLQLGERDKALSVLKEWLAEDPDNPLAQHKLAAFGGSKAPEWASEGYIRNVFDSFADSFEGKLANLQYRAPQLVLAAVAAAVGEPRGDLACLDAGCGTGLCAPLIAPFARSIDGVDLSERMLARARARNLYRRLDQAELTAHLELFDGAYDLIISADTLCYFGSLEAVSKAAMRALRPAGLFIFTVEMADRADQTESYRLNPNGRYTHRESYVRACLEASGFAAITFREAQLRTESGSPVAGLVVSARKA